MSQVDISEVARCRMARIMLVTLVVLVAVFVAVGAHVAQGKQPGLKTIAHIVVHAHYSAPLR